LTTSSAPQSSSQAAFVISVLHTLGPTGTNCEAAAYEWFRRQGRAGSVVLHDTLEQAVEQMPSEPGVALLSCIVYPDLHTLVFSNLDVLWLIDSFVMPTHRMVLASRVPNCAINTVASHPAPRLLAPNNANVKLMSSNSKAASACKAGEVDACITTSVASDAAGLYIVRDFGRVPMGFAIHGRFNPY